MSRKLLVHTRFFAEKHIAAIDAAARARGFEMVFTDDADQAVAAAGDAEILFCAEPRLPKAAPELKWLCLTSAGADAYLKPGAILNPDALLTNSSGAYGVTIAEHVVMVTLELMRRQQEYADVVARRDWVRTLPVRSIRNCRCTLLGTGDIGREAAIRLQAFGPKRVVGVNRGGRNPGEMFDEVVSIDRLDEVLPETDLLVMSLPGTPETKGLMDARRIGLMPADAFLVNVGRGNALDQRALEAHLRAGRLLGAALDVFEKEPIENDDTLWECPRLLITPHVAGNMTLPYTVDRIVELFLEDFDNYCAGRPLKRLVDRQKGY